MCYKKDFLIIYRLCSESKQFIMSYKDGTMWDCGSSIVNALKLPQPCIEPSNSIALQLLMFTPKYINLSIKINKSINQSIYKHMSTTPEKPWSCPMPPLYYAIISMAQRKTAVTPLLTRWTYCSLVLSHRYSEHDLLTDVLVPSNMYVFGRAVLWCLLTKPLLFSAIQP